VFEIVKIMDQSEADSDSQNVAKFTVLEAPPCPLVKKEYDLFTGVANFVYRPPEFTSEVESMTEKVTDNDSRELSQFCEKFSCSSGRYTNWRSKCGMACG
jgi:hypothetical protein